MPRCHRRHQRARPLGIALLILGLFHAPWPQPDYHNVRHHDRPGQVCELHDHLLRWHPDAGEADDVAVLHWHWVLPRSGPDELGHSGDGPAIHAYVSGWDATAPDSGPSVVLDGSARSVDPLPPSPLPLGAAPFARIAHRPGFSDGLGTPRTFGATFAPRIPTASILQRWSC